MTDIESKSLLPEAWWDISVSSIARAAPIQMLDWPLLNNRGIEIAVKRDDLLHPQLSGNKFYKLHGHISNFLVSGKSAIASFGGAYSNHIYALAAAGKSLNVVTIGIIRGEQPASLSPTLKDAEAMGMRLIFVSRAEYKEKNCTVWRKKLEHCIGRSVYWVPEGGGDQVGAQGCYDWGLQAISMSPWVPTHLCVASGTGGTAAGLVAASNGIPVHGFLSIKGTPEDAEGFKHNVVSIAKKLVESSIQAHSDQYSFVLEADYHCGGYAKLPGSLREFILQFEKVVCMPLDPVYTAKLFWGIAKKTESGLWPEGSRLLVFHTGGLQGKRGFTL